jgi:hypothetical protein
VLLLAASTTTLFGGAFHPGGTWTTSSFGSGSQFTPSLTANAAGNGVGVYAGSGNVLGYTVWSSAGWSSPATISASAITKSPPWIDANNGSMAHATYQDASYQYWHLSYTGSWSSALAIGASKQDYGPFAATIAALGTNCAVTFFDGATSNDTAESDLLSGIWQPTNDFSGSTIGGSKSLTVPPAIVAIGTGTDVLIVYADSGTNLQSLRRTSGLWPSAPTPIATASTANYIALAPLANEGALVAFKGETNGLLYWSLYSASGWSPVTAFSQSIVVDGTPAVSHGVGGNVAEMVYVVGGVAYQSELSTTSTWSAPVTVGGTGLLGVALASMP